MCADIQVSITKELNNIRKEKQSRSNMHVLKFQIHTASRKVIFNIACPWSEASFFKIYHAPPRFHAKTYFVLIFLIAIESYLIIATY